MIFTGGKGSDGRSKIKSQIKSKKMIKRTIKIKSRISLTRQPFSYSYS